MASSTFSCIVATIFTLIIIGVVESSSNFNRNKKMANLVAHYDSANLTKSDIDWDPTQIYNVKLWLYLCNENPSGNYQNPHNCNQFIMCDNGAVWLWECPADGGYDPYPDICVYSKYQCPWHSAWDGNPTCETIGQRLWWSPLTLPVHPEVRCGKEIRFCKKFKEIDLGRKYCPTGTSYSKAYNGCLDDWICLAVDTFFGF